MRTYWLSMHVTYACRDAGACCSSGWDIPIEHSRATAVALLRPDRSWLLPAADPSDGAGILATHDGRCVFHDGRCEVHGALGHDAIPSACQHFPRDVLLDSRGAFVTLSHYCPTALALLFEHAGPVEIVEGPPAVPSGIVEGLDARDVLPPLLTRGVLVDYDGYTAWEAHLIDVLTADDGRTADAALAQLDRDLVELQGWRPGRGSLAEAVARLTCSEPAIRTVAAEHEEETVLRRYLAARAFASWMPYQAGGLAAGLSSVYHALALVRQHRDHLPLAESIRRADLELVHLTPRHELAARYRTRR